MENIEHMSIEELQALENKIKKQKDNKIIEKKKEEQKVEEAKTINILSILSKLTTEELDILLPHSRISCSGNSMSNGLILSQGYADCNRCWLNELLENYGDGENPYIDSFINGFSIDLKIREDL